MSRAVYEGYNFSAFSVLINDGICGVCEILIEIFRTASLFIHI